MTNIEIGFAAMGVLMLLLALRMPIGLALILVAVVGTALVRSPRVAISSMGILPYEFMSHWTLSAIPMFVLMGALASNSGMMSLLYSALRLWMGRLPGGLAIATSFAGAGFSALSGSSIATTAAMGKIAVPEMLKAGYDKGLATGTAAAVGTIGALIPPSIIMVLYATFAEESVGKMLIAGLIPGILTAVGYSILIFIRASINPRLAPRQDMPGISFMVKIRALGPVWPVPVVAAGIVVAIYGGYATATEASALGVVIVALVLAVQGKLTWTIIVDSLKQTTATTASILLIAIGATLLTQFLALTGMPQYLATAMASLTDNPMVIVLIACAIYLVLGCFLDPLGVMLLTLPVLLPIFHQMGIDGIWIGVILVKMLEIGLLTPPIGINVFVIKGAVGPDIPMGTIFRGVTWFLVAEVFIMAALLLYPPLITWLPSLMVQ